MTARWLIAGRVQGVGFRFFVRREAGRLGLAGWVRNLPDGRVEVLAAGPVRALEQLEARLRQGPDRAVVSTVDQVEISDEQRDIKSFDIR